MLHKIIFSIVFNLYLMRNANTVSFPGLWKSLKFNNWRQKNDSLIKPLSLGPLDDIDSSTSTKTTKCSWASNHYGINMNMLRYIHDSTYIRCNEGLQVNFILIGDQAKKKLGTTAVHQYMHIVNSTLL